MVKLELDGSLDLRIGKHISLVIDDEGITINDFSEKSELMLTHRINSLEMQNVKHIRTLRLDFDGLKE